MGVSVENRQCAQHSSARDMAIMQQASSDVDIRITTATV